MQEPRQTKQQSIKKKKLKILITIKIFYNGNLKAQIIIIKKDTK